MVIFLYFYFKAHLIEKQKIGVFSLILYGKTHILTMMIYNGDNFHLSYPLFSSLMLY